MLNYKPRPPFGEQNGMAKLTVRAVKAIRRLFKSGEAKRALARGYGAEACGCSAHESTGGALTGCYKKLAFNTASKE